jgi:hypothetical protein
MTSFIGQVYRLGGLTQAFSEDYRLMPCQGNSKVFANFNGQKIVDFIMPWNG